MGALTELYVCVYVAEFPAQALLRLRPELTRTPVVVLQGDAPLEKVCSVNAAAVRQGAVQEMSKSELDSFPGVKMLRRSLVEERAAQAALLDAAGLFTPRIELQPVSRSAWAMVLDMTGTTRMFGTVEQVVKRIAHAMNALKFNVRVGASNNLHAAVCVAPTARRVPIVIPPGSEADRLAPLPLAALELSEKHAQAFAMWGLRTLGELAEIPEVDLIVRLGQQGKRLRLLARGEHPHLMVPQEDVFTLEEFLELDAPVELLESLLFVLGPMLAQVIARAQNHAFALASLTVKMGLDGGGEHERTLKPALPVVDRELLLKLLHLDLQAHPPPAGVLSVAISAQPGERSKVQLGLWSPPLPEPMRLDVTLARIAALVGEERVGCAVLQDTHRPESFRMERFVVPANGSSQQAGRAVALRRCRPPLDIQVRREGDRLHAIHLSGAVYAVQQAYGPWRRSGEWWSAGMWSREEWDVQALRKEEDGNAAKLLCVISHDLLDKRWKLEAFYD